MVFAAQRAFIEISRVFMLSSRKSIWFLTKLTFLLRNMAR